MSASIEGSGSRVLFIARSPRSNRAEESGDPIISQLVAAGLEVEHCPDVYRGLARLCRRGGDFVATIVEVDGLGPSEFDFFPLAAKAKRGTPIYVLARGTHARSSLGKAIASGASGELTPEVIGLLRKVPDVGVVRPSWPSTPTPSEIAAHSDGSRRAGPESKIAPEREPDIDEGSLDPSENDDEHEAPAESEPSRPIRVPWMKQNDRPRRIAPTQPRTTRPPLSDGKAAVPPAPPTSPFAAPSTAGRNESLDRENDEPLLTEEELRALLGDDISAIAPAERGPGAQKPGR